MQLHGFDVSIDIVRPGIEPKKLEEHSQRSEGDSKILAFVCSEDDAEIAVELERAGCDDPISIDVYIDGRWTGYSWWLEKRQKDCWLHKFPIDAKSEVPLKFAKIADATDDNADASGTMEERAIGEIAVNLYKITNIRKVKKRKQDDLVVAAVDDDSIEHSKNKHGGVPPSHYINTGEKTTRKGGSRVQGKWKEHSDEPFARFVFCYAAREVLEAAGVIKVTAEGDAPLMATTSNVGNRTISVKDEDGEQEEVDELECKEEEEL